MIFFRKIRKKTKQQKLQGPEDPVQNDSCAGSLGLNMRREGSFIQNKMYSIMWKIELVVSYRATGVSRINDCTD